MKKVITVTIIVILICAAAIGFFLYSKNSSSNNNNNHNYENYYVDYHLTVSDDGFIWKKPSYTELIEDTYDHEYYRKYYKLITNYSDYLNCYNSIDGWKQSLLEPYNGDIWNDRRSEIEKSTQEIIDKVTKAFERGNYTEEFFANNNLIIIEPSVTGSSSGSMKFNDTSINNGTLTINFEANGGGTTADDLFWLYFFTVPKQTMESISNVNVEINYF